MLNVIKYQEQNNLSDIYRLNVNPLHHSNISMILNNPEVYQGPMRVTDHIDFNVDLSWINLLYSQHTFAALQEMIGTLDNMHANFHDFNIIHNLTRGDLESFFSIQIDLFYYLKVINLAREAIDCFLKEQNSIFAQMIFEQSINAKPSRFCNYWETNKRLYHIFKCVLILEKVKKKYGFKGCINYDQSLIMINTIRHAYICLHTTIGKNSNYPIKPLWRHQRSTYWMSNLIIRICIKYTPNFISKRLANWFK